MQKQIDFEKQSLDNDFLIVEQCEKKQNKVVHKGKQAKNSNKNEDKLLLSDLIGVMGQTNKKPETEDKRPSSDIWNYLDQSQK